MNQMKSYKEFMSGVHSHAWTTLSTHACGIAGNRQRVARCQARTPRPVCVVHQITALQNHYGLPIIQRRGAIHRTHRACNHLVALAKKVLGEIQAAERDIARISQQASGSLRIVLECHTCFDWLMPLMDEFRQHWPNVELDMVSGFHSDPVKLLEEGGADMIIGLDMNLTTSVDSFDK